VGALGREITFGVYGPGEYIGEMSLDGGPRSACVETLEHSVCSIISREVLRGFMAEYPDFAFDLISKVIRRARAATLSAKHMALNDVYGRLKLLFESLGEDGEGESRRMTERLTHKDLAQRLGCSREMVSRVMKDLKGGGYVSQVDGRLVLERPLPPRW
jgi:CRP/FNR family cyclic AMP-dependent transcriptional regulator